MKPLTELLQSSKRRGYATHVDENWLEGFLERILKIDSSVKSSVLTDLLRKFTHLAQSQNTVTGDGPMDIDHV